MEVNNFNLKYQPDGEIEPLESRVSAISIIGHRDPNPLPDCEGPQKHQKYIDVEDVIGFESRQMAKHEECCTLAQYPREENDENSGHEGWKIDKPEVSDIKLLQRERFDVCDEIGLLRQQMSKTEEFHTNILSPSTGVDNDESSRFTGQQMANSEVCDAEFLNCTRKDNDVKRSFKSQFVHQMPDTEHRGTRQFAQTERGKSDEKSGFIGQGMAKPGDCDTHLPQLPAEESEDKIKSNTCQRKREKYFFYEPPLCEETGVWIPVSVPPMSESEHEEWTRGFCTNGGTFPEEDVGWSQFFGEDKELTMWDVFFEMLLVARGKVSSFASTDIRRVSWISSHLVEQAWKEMAQTLTEANFGNTQEILETEPPKWLPDSAASACMLCSVRFHPIMCTRHHCRFCGGIFCNECSKGRRLLPARFRVENPQRVCDVCCVRLESVQPYLMDQVSRAAQLPTHDLTDLSTLRSWLNFPWGQSMEYEIYKCANTIRGYNKVGSLRPEKSIPDAILRQAKGLAILTVMKVGMMVTYNIGTGLVVARREDGSWSPPSAISSFGAGWGAQAGGELTDLIIVLRSNDAVSTFSSDVHLSVGAGLSAAVGIVGRTAEADVRAGTGGYAACYTYSCSKGAFIGCALEGSVVTTRAQENSRFYGSQSLNALDILLGSLPRPPAAAILYRALTDLYQKL